MRTIIGWPAPTKQNTGEAHGSALGEDEIRKTKEILGFDPDLHFDVARRGARRTPARSWTAAGPRTPSGSRASTPGPRPTRTRAALLDRMSERRLPDGWTDALPSFPTEKDGKPNAISTRSASGKVLSALAGVLPELWGGSADLAESNNTTMDGEPSFVPAEHQTKKWPGGPYGRTLHFGIREHAMGSIMNGITLHGGTRVYGGTFLVFSDYMRPPVRLAALMKLPTIYVWTHDSIGLGEDGPTHQPIEHLAALRAIPGLDVVRPADANETAVVLAAGARAHRPADRARRCPGRTCRCSTRRRVAGAAKGGYVLAEASDGHAAGDHHRHRLRGLAGADRPRAARGRGHPDPGGLDAVHRVVPRPRTASYQQQVLPPRGQGPGQRRGRRAAGLARDRRRRRRDRGHRPLRRQRRRRRAVRAVRLHPRPRRRRRAHWTGPHRSAS